MLAQIHSSAFMVVPNITTGTGLPGFALRHWVMPTIMSTTQNQDPTTTSVAPM